MKILVPVDGSAYSLKSVETACNLAKSHQPPSSIVLMAAAVEIPELGEGKFIYEKMKSQAEAALDKAKKMVQNNGLVITEVLATGPSPAEEIVEVAKKEKADLIVIGSRGLGAKTPSFLGGTASQVVTHSPCSVLVVKPQED